MLALEQSIYMVIADLKEKWNIMSGANVKRALASGRSQNYQQADGSVVIPEVLLPYMGGLKKLVA